MKALEGTGTSPADAAERGAHAEGQQLEVAHVEAHGLWRRSVPRTAIQARPMRETSIRWLTNMLTSTRHQEQVVIQHHRGDLEAADAQRLAQVEPEQVTESIWFRPWAVGDVEGWSRLLRNTG